MWCILCLNFYVNIVKNSVSNILEGHNSISYIVCLKIKSNLLYFETREKSRQFVNRKRL